MFAMPLLLSLLKPEFWYESCMGVLDVLAGVPNGVLLLIAMLLVHLDLCSGMLIDGGLDLASLSFSGKRSLIVSRNYLLIRIWFSVFTIPLSILSFNIVNGMHRLLIITKLFDP